MKQLCSSRGYFAHDYGISSSESVGRLLSIIVVLLGAIVSGDAGTISPDDAAKTGTGTSPFINYFANWFVRVDSIRAKQPGWATPVVTSSPGLQELFRYDISLQSLADGHALTSYGSGKGLEFIPFEPVQFTVGLPAWQTENTSPPKNGWSDESFLMKYRLWSGNEQNGNYILSAFFGLTVPNGSANYTQLHLYRPDCILTRGMTSPGRPWLIRSRVVRAASSRGW